MAENKGKVETYIGFAIRAGKFRCGVNAIGTLKRCDLLILCGTAMKNTQKEALKLSRKFHCKVIKTNGITVESITAKENCKLLAVLDLSLAKAILDNLGDKFTEYELEA